MAASCERPNGSVCRKQLLESSHCRIRAGKDAAPAPRRYALGGAGHRELAKQQRIAVVEFLGGDGDLLVVFRAVAALQRGEGGGDRAHADVDARIARGGHLLELGAHRRQAWFESGQQGDGFAVADTCCC